MKKKFITLALAVVMCLSVITSVTAASSLNRVTSTIPGTDIQYEYVEKVTVQIPGSVETFDLVNVSAEVGYSVEEYYGADYQEVPHYRFTFLGEKGSVKINQNMMLSNGVHTLEYDEDYGYYDDSGIYDMTAFSGDTFNMNENDSSEKSYIILQSPVYDTNVYDDDFEVISEGEIIAVVEFYMGTYFEQSEEEIPNTFVPDEWEKIDISTLALIDESEAEYSILDGANSVWNSNSADSLAIRADGDFSKFTGVKVDGEMVGSSNYTAKEGSTIVEFKADYLKSLDTGKHNVIIMFEDGEVSTTFEIKTATSNVTDVVIPNTDANTSVAPIFVAMTISGVALIGLKKKSK